jgi:cell division GTPase FtsZ
MVNKKIWLGMLACLLIFGMVVVGCDDGSKNDDPPPASNYLKITGVTAAIDYVAVCQTGITSADVQTAMSGGDASKMIAYQQGIAAANAESIALLSNKQPWRGSGTFDVVITESNNSVVKVKRNVTLTAGETATIAYSGFESL